jgi:catechol 2,3-dioxygenase-like lactoylglutathione lyase family enzyme
MSALSPTCPRNGAHCEGCIEKRERRNRWKKPRIRHIAINVQDREKVAEYYKKVLGLEEKERGENGTIYLSDGFVDVALIMSTRVPWGIHHFGFQVESIKAIEEIAQTVAKPSVAGVHAEYKVYDPEGNSVDLSEEGWPI